MMTEEQKQHRQKIKEWYAIMLPELKKDTRIDPYGINWTKYFSPIEHMAWSVIRQIGIPLYPEYPAYGYYIDFADPIKQIGVELDGAQFHNVKKDMDRDLILWKRGWTIIRISGKEMNGIEVDDINDEILDMEADGYDPDEVKSAKDGLIDTWINKTGDGILHSIAAVYYEHKNGFMTCVDQEDLREALKQHSFLPLLK